MEESSTVRRLIRLIPFAFLLVSGLSERPRSSPVPTSLSRTDLAELAYLSRIPVPDPMLGGRSVAHWRTVVRSGGLLFSPFGMHIGFRHGKEEYWVSVWSPEARTMCALFLALAADPDPGVRLVAARGLGTMHGEDWELAAGALVVLTRDPDPAVRHLAARALTLFAWTLLGEDELRNLTAEILKESAEAAYPLGVSPLLPAELAALSARDVPLPCELALAVAGDTDFEEVARFQGLAVLYARQARVTDTGLAHLGGLDRLAVLDLRGSAGVTDAGLDQLAGLRGLRCVMLTGTGVTRAGADRLRAARPDVEVRY
jgi:hypothetical protein